MAIESLRPQVEKIVNRLLMPLRRSHRTDILPQFAHPLPAYVIAELLSVPESPHEEFIRWSNAVATLFGNCCAADDFVKLIATDADKLVSANTMKCFNSELGIGTG